MSAVVASGVLPENMSPDTAIMHAVGGVELTIPLFDGSLILRGKAWGNPRVDPARRVLAWPGWLDNCGSWYTSGPLYAAKGYYFVAIDPVGCGLSQHRGKGGFYNDFEECLHQIMVADHLGWTEPFILIGHSRGSNISSVTAGVFLERIRSVALLETGLSMFGCYAASYPGTYPDEEFQSGKGVLMGSLRELYGERARRGNRQPKRFKDFKTAVQHNFKHPFFVKTWETSTNIVSRHLGYVFGNENAPGKKKGLKFTFTHDTQTYGQNQSHCIHPRANIAIKQNIYCPTLCVCIAESSWGALYDFDSVPHFIFGRVIPKHLERQSFLDRQRYVAAVKDFTLKLTPGKHHVHSDDAEMITDIVFDYLDKRIHRAKEEHFELFGPKDVFNPPAVMDLRKLAFAHYRHLLLVPDDTIDSSKDNSTADLSVKHVAQNFTFFGKKITSVIYGNVESQNRFICIHDDQDNAAVFHLLAKELVTKLDCCVVAYDRQGRGGSDRVDGYQFYDPCEEPPVIFDIADTLKWDTFSLIAHCRGSVISIMAASAFPERVQSVVYIAQFTPTSEALSLPNEFIPSDMYYSYLENRDKDRCTPSISVEKFYRSSNTEGLIKARNSAFDYAQDAKIDRRPPLCCAEETVERCLTKILSPVLIISPVNAQTEAITAFLNSTASDDTGRKMFTRTQQEIGWFEETQVDIATVRGSRYYQVDQAPDCAETIINFVNRISKQTVERRHLAKV